MLAIDFHVFQSTALVLLMFQIGCFYDLFFILIDFKKLVACFKKIVFSFIIFFYIGFCNCITLK